jgi:hypothetical protein
MIVVRVRRQKKQVYGSEAMIAGMGCRTVAFVRWLFPFSFLFCGSAKQKFLSS